MKIDRDRAVAAFTAYVEQYDRKDEKIRLKIEHTERVSALCEQIAGSLELTEDEVNLAWLIGLLHDVGRFEQLRRFGTFIDAQSVDHAALGAEILFEQGRIRQYVESDEEDGLLLTAVASHSAYRLEEDLDARTGMYCNIIRDADKIDILKVNVDFPLEEIYNVTTEELKSGEVTEAVMDSFREKHATLRSLKSTAVDYVVGHISLVFELVYPESLKEVLRQGYLDRLLNFESQSEKTAGQFAKIRAIMREYLQLTRGHTPQSCQNPHLQGRR